MKKQIKKRGFTLVELLATITILSVVMIIAIPSVTELIKKFGNNYYEIVEENIELAGIDYFTDHKTEIPKYISESSEISLEELVSKGYIEETPKDKNKEEITEGYVIAYKTNKGKYDYQACINTKNNDYKTDKKYCSEKYKLYNNVILVPPSNGVYALPQKMPENFDDFNKIITPYAATLQTKENNSSRKPPEDTVFPTKAIVSCEGECNGIEGTHKENLEEKLDAIISNYFKGVTKDTYTSKLKEFLNKKIKIKYIYQYEGKTAEALFSFVEANEGETPGEIQVVLNKETENGGQVYGIVKDEAWEPTDIPENTNLINWYNKKLVATISPINTNEKRIKKYYCESKSNPGNIFECSDETINNSIQRISYSEINDIIKIYGVNKYGIPTPNTVTYSVKTDSVSPAIPTSTINEKRVNGYNKDGKWTNETITWSGFASEAYSGINRYEVRNANDDNDTPSTLDDWHKYPIIGLDNGVRNSSFQIRAVSNSGNNSEWSDVYNIKVDQTKPTVPTSKVDNKVSTGGTYGWTKEDITWSDFSSTDTGSGILKYEYINASGSVGTLSPNYNYPLNNAKTMNWTFKIRAVDNVGNTSDWSNYYTFRIDQTTPTFTVTVKKKNNGNNLDGNSNISSLANYTDNTWFNGYTFVKIESLTSGPSGATVTCTDSRPNYGTFSTYRNVNTAGTTIISCQATSGAGLKSSTITKTINLDRSYPQATKLQFRYNNKKCPDGWVEIQFDKFDKNYEISSIKYCHSYNDSSYSKCNILNSSSNETWCRGYASVKNNKMKIYVTLTNTHNNLEKTLTQTCSWNQMYNANDTFNSSWHDCT